MAKQLAFSEFQMQAAIYAALAFRHQNRVTANESQIDEMIGDLSQVKSTDRRYSTNPKVNKLIKEMLLVTSYQGLTEGENMSAVYLVGAGYALHILEPSLRVSGENLETFRSAVTSRSKSMMEGNLMWPPSKQTVAAKLGSGTWNGALAYLGFTTTGRSIDTYSHKYKKSDFAEALSEFTVYCAEMDRYPSIGSYHIWHSSYKGTLPNADAVRKHYKNWSEVVRIVESDLSIFDRGR